MAFTVRNLMQSLRDGKFTSIGSYPTYFVTGDGEALSHEAVRENLWQIARATREYAKGERWSVDTRQWAVIGAYINYEDEDLTCAHTGKPIECAYPSEAEAT